MGIIRTIDKKIGAFEARRQFGQILKEVEMKRESFVVERHGEAVAAVVPIAVYDQWKKGRKEFFDQIKSAADTANLDEEEAEEVIARALKAAARHA